MTDTKLLLYMVLNEFDGLKLAEFDDRLTLQKRVYLLQLFRFDMGYRYNWYVRGPYSPQLTEDAFGAQAQRKDIRDKSKGYVLAKGSKEKIANYRSFEAQLDSNHLPLLLELTASIHYLLHIGFLFGDKNSDNIAHSLRKRGKSFTDDQLQAAWSLLDKYGLIHNSVIS